MKKKLVDWLDQWQIVKKISVHLVVVKMYLPVKEMSKKNVLKNAVLKLLKKIKLTSNALIVKTLNTLFKLFAPCNSKKKKKTHKRNLVIQIFAIYVVYCTL